MTKYLVACGCGKQLAVAPGQAGEAIRCECGATVTVPTLRRLRHLPAASEERTGAAGAWGVAHGAAAVLVIAAIGSLALAGYSWWSTPSQPEFNPVVWTQQIDRQISELTPAEAWKSWRDIYRPLGAAGFSEMQHPQAAAIQVVIDSRRRMQVVLVSLAAVCLLAAAACWLGAGRSTR